MWVVRATKFVEKLSHMNFNKIDIDMNLVVFGSGKFLIEMELFNELESVRFN
jgi:hypothetical protein